MNLLSGLEKFGLDITKGKNLFAEEEKKPQKQEEEKTEEVHIPTEEEFLLDKRIQCKVCDKTFVAKMVKNGRTKRMEPDADLRPRFQYIDTLKYDVASCPHCGYTAMNRYFERISSAQIKLIREEICSKFKSVPVVEGKTVSYDKAIERYKLSLINTIVKRGKDSEKAYTCLKISWLLRGKIEELQEANPKPAEEIEKCRAEEEQFYEQAYEGFMKAIAKEVYPICGMEQSTMDYLLSYMSFHFKKYEVASKFLASVLTSASANRRMKDMALELKEQIIEELKRK